MKFTAPIISLFGPRWVINSLLVLSTRQFYPHDQRLRSLCLFKSPFLVRHPQQGGRLDHWKFGELDRPPREIATRGRHTMCRMHTALLAVKLLQLSRWVRNPFLIGSRKMGARQVFLEPSTGPSEPKHFGWPAEPPSPREEGGQICVSITAVTLIFSSFNQNISCP